MALKLLLLATVAILAAWSLQDAQGTFAASPGFSGRSGFTCISCHLPPSPTHDDARAILEGLPSEWTAKATYTLKVRVEGGPPAMPSPAPQGGFDLASDGGRFDVSAHADLLRMSGSSEVTYLPAGTMMRSWELDWQAPDLSTQPAPVTFWLAVLAANGNHVVALNQSDLGETLDSTDAIQVVVPPSTDAIAAWNALPLLPPTTTLSQPGLISGQHTDPLATGIRVTIDGDEQSERATGPSFVIDISDLLPGERNIEVASIGAGRASPAVPLTVVIAPETSVDSQTPAQQSKPAPALPAASVVLLFLATVQQHHLRRSHRT